MSKALDPLRRLVVQFNARFAHTRAFPNATLPQPAPPHLTAPNHQAATTASAAAHLTAPIPKPALPYFGNFQTKAPLPSHKDGPLLLAHLNQQLNTLARQVFVPEPARVAAVNYACKSAGRPQMASLLAQSSQRMMHHQPLRFASAVPHGFARGVGLSSTRGFCSVGPAVNGPVKMMAQMYAKPLGSMPAHAQKMSSEKDGNRQPIAKKHRSHKKSGEIKKRTAVNRLSPLTIKAFLNRAAQVEQQHQILNLCKTNVAPAISTATAISLAKVAGKTELELQALPKLQFSETCPTQVDMCFLLDASPLWHLDTMVAALHTDSLRAPKELNRRFIDDLLEITHAQYQHFLEVSSILQKLVQCPESREITLEGYELRVHFSGTTLFDMIQFLRQLAIDPRSPHFDLEEVYPNHADMEEQYFPQASVNRYYEPSHSDNETWDDCSSIQSSLMMFTDSERCESVASFATLESLPEQESPWDSVQPNDASSDEIVQHEDDIQEEQEQAQEQDVHIREDMSTTPTVSTADLLFPGEEPVSPWNNNASPESSSIMIQESTENLDKLSSRILNASTVVNQEYFDDIRGFLDNLEAVHRHSERLFGSTVSTITA
ncbi:hypothetical protein BGZ96_005449 [Linnemannia gamsii]|uniref:Uncharacterized protein n=1 Tax=Linnemannia gamsii TaxID=64522 RepID=A0ABQ7K575_9FUNG|nr:hypothetical protein BGZ96_005449 [Linnemannia gamsii]